LVILEGEFSVLGGNCSILLRDGILLGLDLGSQYVDGGRDELEELHHGSSKVGSAFSDCFEPLEDIVIVEISTHDFVVW